MSNDPVTILGVDPGLRNTGWGVITVEGARMSWRGHGVVKPSTDAPMSERLAAIVQGLRDVVGRYQPDCAAIEETFVNQNPKSTLLLGQARGAAMASLALAGLEVEEYAARKIKQCIVGTGAADKSQMGFMIAKLLPKAGNMTDDAADALAVAITRANHLNMPSAPLMKADTSSRAGAGARSRRPGWKASA